MGDRTYASCTLGGTIQTAEGAKALAEVISLHYGFDGGGLAHNPTEAASWLLDTILADNGEVPRLNDEEANYGEMEDLTELAHEIGLAYDLTWDSGDCYDAGTRVWHPGLPEPLEAPVSDGEITVPFNELQAALAENGPDGLVALVGEYELRSGVFPEEYQGLKATDEALEELHRIAGRPMPGSLPSP